MSRFSRQWVIHLNISSQDFVDAFHQIIRKDDTWVLETPFIPATNTHRDFFGSVQQHSFRIWKRQGLFDFKGAPELYGKIIDNGNAIQIELRMVNNFRFNYFSIFFLDIIIGFFLLVPFTGLTKIGSAGAGISGTTYLILAGTAMCGVAHYIQLKLIDKYLDKLENWYDQALLAIGATVKNKAY